MEWIQSHLVHLGIGAITLIAIPLAKKLIPSLAKKYADIFLKAAAEPDITDLADKADVIIILKASMRIAARRMEGKSGQEKMAWVVDYVCAKTSLRREDVLMIAQGVYDAVASELKEHGEMATGGVISGSVNTI